MMELEMTITQGDNGWVIEYRESDCSEKKVVTTSWARVIKEVNDYFGWYDSEDGHSYKPPL